MKKILFIALMGVVMAACDYKPYTVEDAITEAELKPITEINLFLGFRFGMTEKDVKHHLDSLKKAGKVYPDEYGRPTYDFYHSYTSESWKPIKLGFSAFYDNDSLYQMVYLFRNYDKYLLDISAAINTFRKSGIDGFKEFSIHEKDKDVEHFTNEYYIKDNLIVKFSNLNGYISYTNAPIAKKIRDIEEEAERKLKQLLDDATSERKEGTLSDF